jgi:hypothetical protein
MAKLLVVADYQAGPLAYRKGETINVPDEFAEFLLRDSPGSFEPVDADGGGDDEHDADGSVTRPAPRGRRR